MLKAQRYTHINDLPSAEVEVDSDKDTSSQNQNSRVEVEQNYIDPFIAFGVMPIRKPE